MDFMLSNLKKRRIVACLLVCFIGVGGLLLVRSLRAPVLRLLNNQNYEQKFTEPTSSPDITIPPLKPKETGEQRAERIVRSLARRLEKRLKEPSSNYFLGFQNCNIHPVFSAEMFQVGIVCGAGTTTATITIFPNQQQGCELKKMIEKGEIIVKLESNMSKPSVCPSYQ